MRIASRLIIVTIAIALSLFGVRCTRAEEAPASYPLKYPAADEFCPPVDGFFDEVTRTVEKVGRRIVRHQPNGGYGLPVQDKVGDRHLIHLGADVGFYRVGEPVFAVANGVVRISQGENEASAARKKPKRSAKTKAPSPQPSPGGRGSKKLAWGNFVVIEHRLADGGYVTTVYGHLSNDRLVKAGDVVHVGQLIGTIGTTRVNGGYTPHLHLGVRSGRVAEVGRKFLLMTMEGKRTQLEIAELRANSVVLTGASELSGELQMGLDGRKFQITKRGDNAEVNPAMLTYLPSPEFMIVGYGLTTDGWLDPIAFLRDHGADVNPAPFVSAKRGRKQGADSAEK